MKVAFIHYWLVGMRGGEHVLAEFCKIYPQADIYTHVYDKSQLSDRLKKHKIFTTFISRMPFARKWYQLYLPLMPIALESLDLDEYDLVISFESGPAKGVIVAPDATHICYCHSPMRYLWDMHSEYFSDNGIIKRLLMAPLLHYLRLWDVSSSHRVDGYIANSSFVKRRIQKYYRRESTVIHPPVAIDEFSKNQQSVGGKKFFLFVGQLVKYKRTDLAIDAFNQNGKNLYIVGDGEERQALEKRANPNITFLGKVGHDDLKRYYSDCEALIFPGVEDFGIVPLEAMAAGKPVIALRKGGAVDSIIENRTGIFFDEPTCEALSAAVVDFENRSATFDPGEIERHARKFGETEFRSAVVDYMSKFLERRV